MSITGFIFFVAIILGTLLITYWAAKQTKTANHYYTAGGQLTGFQNGLAIAGDYMSAASFLGITGAIALYGFDGFFYSIGFLVSYLFLLVLIAEPVRQLGKYTIGDVITSRFPSKTMRAYLSFSTVFISILYMVAQLVAAGAIIKLLSGVSNSLAVVSVGILMIVYVVFGGMMATSWVQIVKTVLLMIGTFMLCLIVLSQFDWSFSLMLDAVTVATPMGDVYLNPGHMFVDSLDTLSLNLALVLGTAGLPHILIRFLTVKDRLTVRRSVLSATCTIGIFYVMTVILGFGTVIFVSWQELMRLDDSGNIAAPLLASYLGGDFLMAFVSAIAFATILAVVSGLIISASTSFAHDFYKHVWKNGRTSEKKQMLVAKLAAVCVGLISIFLALGAQHINVAAFVSLIFSIAASAHFPLLLLTIYWKRFTQQGAKAAILTGLFSSVVLVLCSPNVMNNGKTGLLTSDPIFPLNNPGIISIPLSFLFAILVSQWTYTPSSGKDYKSIVIQTEVGR